jgi:hypothetical protein
MAFGIGDTWTASFMKPIMTNSDEVKSDDLDGHGTWTI